MSHANPALSFAPALDPALLAAVQHRAFVTARVAGFLMACAAAASLMWLILAGPGFTTGHASTTTPRHLVR